jgi:hypothetical protein
MRERNPPDGLRWASVGSTHCPECGLEAAQTRRPGPWERVRTWLVFGQATPPSAICPNGHEWQQSIGSYMVLRRRRRWVSLPVELVRRVLHQRMAMPVPLIYVLAGAVGLVLGVGLDLLLGWPWWSVAVGAVAVVWLIFLSTALHGPHRIRFDDLLEVIDFEKAEARRQRRLEAAVREGRRVVYGVDGWAGPIAGWAARLSDAVTLDHGDREAGHWISVTTAPGPDDGRDEEHRLRLHSDLLSEALPRPEGFDPEAMARRRVEVEREFGEAPPWEPVSVIVDGAAVPAVTLGIRGWWAAVVRVGGTIVEVRGRGGAAAATRLRRLTTLEPYFEGALALRERHRRENEE